MTAPAARETASAARSGPLARSRKPCRARRRQAAAVVSVAASSSGGSQADPVVRSAATAKNSRSGIAVIEE